MIITSTGKPIALLTNIKGSSIEQEIRIDAMARGATAVSKLRTHAQKQGFPGCGKRQSSLKLRKAEKVAERFHGSGYRY